ncbi:MAG: RecX family transcriptional regulator [Thermoleophilia bacterium]|nr:RecX family transcriptional regulator [Thermoleophilia bacterium]
MEVDGRPWRTLPVAAIAAAGLYTGCELDRERLRRLARARRRAEALDAAAGALRRRALSEQEIDQRLARRGVPTGARRETRDVLQRAGHVDDGRLAHEYAGTLAHRGYGDGAIRWRLEQRGVGADLAAEAIAALEPESARACRLVAARGRTSSTARYLAARGFDHEAIEAAFEDGVAPDP